ncbi:hypothetical protein GUJ93_ZPchr0005g16004 [Zizania palustris]|uniref:Uncharacterized protein n=1 Tax=Zizania palustris TaxID=103762 RepID=A0A8J5T581_ZIZPA|nr:hypothetical protein GUJ93_ZPchr0005g16004 [Zizania palustris]
MWMNLGKAGECRVMIDIYLLDPVHEGGVGSGMKETGSKDSGGACSGTTAMGFGDGGDGSRSDERSSVATGPEGGMGCGSDVRSLVATAFGDDDDGLRGRRGLRERRQWAEFGARELEMKLGFQTVGVKTFI